MVHGVRNRGRAEWKRTGEAGEGVYHGRPADMDKWLAEKKTETGRFYRMMIEHVQKTLKDLKHVYPDYKEEQGYEIAGFVWLQGFNDMVDSQTYPERGKPGRFNEYSRLLECFIRDVRKDLNAPKMPFCDRRHGRGRVD